MADKLLYRIPGYDIVKKSGRFVHLDDVKEYSGFVLSDFTQKQLFGFEEKELGNDDPIYTELPNVWEKTEYLEKADEFLRAIKVGGLGKAVLSRVKVVPFNKEPEALFNALCLKYPNAFVYYFSSDLLGNWIGATPEVLINRKQDELYTMALAGTLPNSDVFAWSEKEREEQRMVEEYIIHQLKSADVTFKFGMRGEEFEAGPVKHLVTEIKINGSADALKTAMNLHPTPAVSGLPVRDAIQLIEQTEAHNRELYTGFLGVIGDETHLYVNLRCAKLLGNKMFLFLGGGFTKDSVPEKEWEETEKKSKTLLNVVENL